MFQLENSHYNLEKINFNVDKIFNDKIKDPFENTIFFEEAEKLVCLLTC